MVGMRAGIVIVAALLSLAAGFEPARLISAPLPQPPPNVIGWTEVLLDVEIDASGTVARITPLRATPSSSDLVAGAVGGWRFSPATDDDERPTASHALVAAVFRPPQLYGGPAPGSPPQDLAAPSDAIPFPIAHVQPPHPPSVISGGVVLVEALVGPDGDVGQARLVGSGAGFEQAALDAARGWRFRPARRDGNPVSAYVYLIFGFRVPL